MTQPPVPEDESIQNQLIRAARDLMCAVYESGDDFVLFMDRRRLHTRVFCEPHGHFSVHWEDDEGEWLTCVATFESPREAAFHAYQGPH